MCTSGPAQFFDGFSLYSSAEYKLPIEGFQEPNIVSLDKGALGDVNAPKEDYIRVIFIIQRT